jgi:hypothetical protein
MANFPFFRMTVLGCSSVLVLLCVQLAGQGAIRFELPQVVVVGNGVSPTTGLVDVVVRADAADLPKLVSAFNVDFAFTNATPIQFKPPQTAPNPLIHGTPLNFSPNAQHVRAALDLATGATSLVDGMGLVRVPFEVPAGATGVFPLAFGPANQLSDMDANAISLQTTDVGSITIHALLSGDYNANGSVGPEDYMQWRASVGSTGSLPADGNGDHVVDAADYVIWRKNFGSGSSAGPGQATNLASKEIPEPATLVLLLSAQLFVCSRRRTLS